MGTPATITDKNENSYVVALQQQADGSLTVTITPKTMQGCYQITKVSIGGQTYSPNDDGSYTIENVSSGAVITVTIEDVGYSVDDDGNYTVTNEKGLLAWAQTVAQEETSPDCTLLQDITLTNWVSAGNGFASTYAGTFDGQGHTITLQGGSLFHYIAEGGGVQNLIVDLQGATISTSTSPAGAIANTNKGTIQNCMVKNGTVTTSNGNVGGIAGENYGIIKGCCTVDMSITQSGINNAGGIAGSNQSDGQIIACCAVNCTTSTSTQASHGGILGINRGMVDTCYWEGEDEEGIGANLKDGVASSVDKISDSTTCESAIAAMNAKGGNYTLGSDGKPTLAISAANDPVGQLLRAARLFGL